MYLHEYIAAAERPSAVHADITNTIRGINELHRPGFMSVWGVRPNKAPQIWGPTFWKVIFWHWTFTASKWQNILKFSWYCFAGISTEGMVQQHWVTETRNKDQGSTHLYRTGLHIWKSGTGIVYILSGTLVQWETPSCRRRNGGLCQIVKKMTLSFCVHELLFGAISSRDELAWTWWSLPDCSLAKYTNLNLNPSSNTNHFLPL